MQLIKYSQDLSFKTVRNDFLKKQLTIQWRGGSVVECRTPEREVRGSRPTSAVLCPFFFFLSKTLYSPKVMVNYPGSDGSVPT